MICIRISKSITLVLAIALVLGGVCRLQAVTVNFSQVGYTAAPGDTFDLVVRFSEPVPNGLEGYALRMNFDSGLLGFSQIAVEPELDFDAFADAPADKDSFSDYAYVAGFTDVGEPAYTGIDFVVFTVTVSLAAADGVYSLELAPLFPDAFSFVDGTGAVIDDDLVFGSASLTVSSAVAAISDFRIERQAGQMAIRFAATPGFDYLIEYNTDLATDTWTTLTTVSPPADGQVEVLDPVPASGNRRFYRASTP